MDSKNIQVRDRRSVLDRIPKMAAKPSYGYEDFNAKICLETKDYREVIKEEIKIQKKKIEQK